MTLQNRRSIWGRVAAIGLTVGFLFVSTGCGGAPEEVDRPTIISYAAAADRLRGLDQAEVQEQLRDWARTGLAAELELDTPQLRDALYDTAPVRDPAFVDLAEQPIGPGRALFDGRDTLHVLVPRDDPHKARTIGLLIDGYRTDAGADPAQVQVHHYQVHPAAQAIELTDEDPLPASEVRSTNGYVEMRVDETTDALAGFLARTSHLSLLEVRDSEIWAGGWNWSDVPGARLSLEDVSVLQRGYLASDTEPLPGFSLDPGPPETVEDVLTLLPDLSPELAERLTFDDWAGSVFPSADAVAQTVDSALFINEPPPEVLAELGLPADRIQLYVLSRLFEGQPLYSQARYDGGLAGTEVGMTLFYTDMVTKNWITGVGSGVPTDAVGGFIPNPEAVIPWSHCPGPDASHSEFGRLWFGANEVGFDFADSRVSIGSHATRLFSRSEGADGTEVEPSYRFGRGLRWWDRHFQQVADYEPQYHRLDQIMRWSGALEWLVSESGTRLPRLDDTEIQADLRFQDWYAQHDELRERSEIDFVEPPSAEQEAILPQPSESYDQCGLRGLIGGVSLSDLVRRSGDQALHADLPVPVRRAGPVAAESTFDPATGTGTITRLSIDGNGQVADRLTRTFSILPDDSVRVQVVGDGRRVAQFGDLKIWRSENAQRLIEVQLAAGPGQVSQRVGLQGQEVGRLVTRKTADSVTVQWHAGPLDRLRHALESLQDRWTSGSVTGPPQATDGVLYAYQKPDGNLVYKIGDGDSPWLSISSDTRPPGDDLVIRFGGRNPDTGLPEFFQATLSGPPEVPHGGGPAEWVNVFPATADRPALFIGADPPRPDTLTVRVTTPDGKMVGIVHDGEGSPRVRSDDPLLGINGPPEVAALLRDSPRAAEAIRVAAQADDGLFRAVVLGPDGVALAGAREVIVAPADHPWAAAVRQAVDQQNPGRTPLLRLDGGRAVHVDLSELTVRPHPQQMSLGDVLDSTGTDVYVHRSMLQFQDGLLVRDSVPRDAEVTVQVAEASDQANAHSATWRPHSRFHEGAEWVRVTVGLGLTLGGAGLGINSSAVPGPPGNAPTQPGGIPVSAGQFLLICPADPDTDAAGCGR